MMTRSARANRNWTGAEERRLIELRSEGTKLAQIAKELGRSIDSVQQRLTGIALRKKLREPVG